jgi:peptidyl-prolyl cis-trans isomerase D
MSSTKNEEVEKKPSIHSLREQKQNRLIIIGFVVTIALIVGMVGYALLYDSVIKNFIPVAKVDSSRIDNEYFVNRVHLERNAYIQQYNYVYAEYQMFASSAEYQQYFASQLNQIKSVLDDYEMFGSTVLDNMIDDQVIANKAKEMGIEVTDAELNEFIQTLFYYYPNGTPTPEPTSTPYVTPSPSAEQLALLGNSPTPVVEAEEAADTEAEEAAEAEEVEAAVPEEEVTPEVSADGTPAPTATPYTEELYQQSYQEYINSLQEIGVSENYLRLYVYHYLLNQKVQNKIYADTPLDQDQVWARHILVETEDEAKQVKSRLDSGEDWNAIAAEVSLDTSNNTNGGDLGWFAHGTMVQAFEDAAFALQSGQISDPVQTDFGWHIIQVIGHEVRPLSETDYQYAQQTAYTDWLAAAKEEMTIKKNDVWKDIVPKEPNISQDLLVN